MLPCQSACTLFHTGCHKTCPAWRVYQEDQRLEREKIKSYLQYHNHRCRQVTRQLLQMQARRLAW